MTFKSAWQREGGPEQKGSRAAVWLYRLFSFFFFFLQITWRLLKKVGFFVVVSVFLTAHSKFLERADRGQVVLTQINITHGSTVPLGGRLHHELLTHLERQI